MRWTEQQLVEHMAGRGEPVPTAPAKPSKYHAVLEECDGIRFQSKKEARVYRELCCRRHAGEVKFFLTQVPFRLKAGYKHLLDFMVIRVDGGIEYIEAKGRDLPMGKMKRKMVEDEYKIVISVV